MIHYIALNNMRTCGVAKYEPVAAGYRFILTHEPYEYKSYASITYAERSATVLNDFVGFDMFKAVTREITNDL